MCRGAAGGEALADQIGADAGALGGGVDGDGGEAEAGDFFDDGDGTEGDVAGAAEAFDEAGFGVGWEGGAEEGADWGGVWNFLRSKSSLRRTHKLVITPPHGVGLASVDD